MRRNLIIMGSLSTVGQCNVAASCSSLGSDICFSNALLLTLDLFPSLHFPVHFFTYDHEFINQYCHVSALLELESLLSQQSLREAFSDSELITAKQRHQQVQDYLQVWGKGRTADPLGAMPQARRSACLVCSLCNHPRGSVSSFYCPNPSAPSFRTQGQLCSCSSRMDDFFPLILSSPGVPSDPFLSHHCAAGSRWYSSDSSRMILLLLSSAEILKLGWDRHFSCRIIPVLWDKRCPPKPPSHHV